MFFWKAGKALVIYPIGIYSTIIKATILLREARNNIMGPEGTEIN